jgi:glutamate-1-semialdehyde 2,1-aminomutase
MTTDFNVELRGKKNPPPVQDWLERSRNCIAQGALTNSKHPDTDVLGVFPTHFDYGEGAYLISNGKKYLDYVCGLGAIHFGYQDLARTYAGGCLSGNSIQEVITAERIKERFAYIERVKFVNDGTEGCTAAVRIARAYTGRKLVISEGYHGWSDEFTALNDNATGIGAQFQTVKVSDIGDIFKMVIDPKAIAAIIIEPVMLDASDARKNTLKAVREFCNVNGVVLIFDEVVTGLRFKDLAVSNHFGINPDLGVYGKAFANGHKIGFVGGNAALMDGDYFVSGTYFGQIPALDACSNILNDKNLVAATERLNDGGLAFFDEFNKLAPELITMQGWGCRANFVGEWETIALFRQFLIEHRIFTKTTFFLNFMNARKLNDLLACSQMAFEAIKSGEYVLKGQMPKKPLAMKVRGQ